MFKKVLSKLSWKQSVALVTAGFALMLPLVHILIFRDGYNLGFYWALDLCFVPVQVLVVTLIVENVLGERERAAKFHKLNMVIGAFFSEVGGEAIRRINEFCGDLDETRERFAVDMHWGHEQYQEALAFARGNSCKLDHDETRMEGLKLFLLEKRQFVLGLLQNPNLLEHDSFTDLLWALCHLTEELAARPGLEGLPATDVEHLKGDMRRAFNLLVVQWLAYMEHLKRSYPYIYSLQVRQNPFKQERNVVVQG